MRTCVVIAVMALASPAARAQQIEKSGGFVERLGNDWAGLQVDASGKMLRTPDYALVKGNAGFRVNCLRNRITIAGAEFHSRTSTDLEGETYFLVTYLQNVIWRRYERRETGTSWTSPMLRHFHTFGAKAASFQLGPVNVVVYASLFAGVEAQMTCTAQAAGAGAAGFARAMCRGIAGVEAHIIILGVGLQATLDFFNNTLSSAMLASIGGLQGQLTYEFRAIRLRLQAYVRVLFWKIKKTLVDVSRGTYKRVLLSSNEPPNLPDPDQEGWERERRRRRQAEERRGPLDMPPGDEPLPMPLGSDPARRGGAGWFEPRRPAPLDAVLALLREPSEAWYGRERPTPPPPPPRPRAKPRPEPRPPADPPQAGERRVEREGRERRER